MKPFTLAIIAIVASGCWLFDPSVPNESRARAAMEKCRGEARKAFYAPDSGLTPDDAEAVFDRCLEREGV